MNKKRLFLIFVSVLFCALQSGYAGNKVLTNWTDGGTDYKDKYAYDEKWYDATASEYTISTPEQLGAFAAVSDTATFEGKTVKLTADLDMRKYGWVSIGKAGFKGTFDGNGHTVSNMYYTSLTSVKAFGFFYTIDGGTVKNVMLTESSFTNGGETETSVGGIAGVLKGGGKIINCGLSGSIQMMITDPEESTSFLAGGIVGRNEEGTISNCFVKNESPIIPNDTIYGNIAGMSAGTIENCYYLKNDTLPGAVNSHRSQGTINNVEGLDWDAFTSGKVACLLNVNNEGVWGQGENFPVFAGETAPVYYKINYPEAPEHGKVTGLEYAHAGKRVVLASTADDGYWVSDLSVGDVELINYSTFSMPEKDVTVSYEVKPLSSASILALPAESVEDFSFVAKWNKVEGATDYKITVKKDGKALASYSALAVGNVTTAKVEGLLPNTLYTYTVQSVKSGTTSAESNVVEVTTENVKTWLVSKECRAMNIAWNEVPNSAKYVISITNKIDETTESTETTDSESRLEGLNVGFTYSVAVAAYDNAGNVMTTSEPLLVTTDTDYGVQLTNSSFETWEKVAKEREPIGWNSFMSGDGPLVSFTQDMHMDKSNDIRPGSTGKHSVRIWTKNAMGLPIPANGNLTCGRINSGAMIATDQANHNRTVVGDSEFSQPLQDARPDSLTVWVNYSHTGDSVMNARISAIIHDSYNFADPSSTVDSLHVFATAQLNYAAVDSLKGGWMRLSIPFDYELKEYDAFYEKMNNSQEWKDSLKVDKFVRPASADYMLVSFATNSTPGIGHEGDQVIIDDMVLIYNPKLALTKTDLSTYVPGATMSVDYTLEGTMSPSNLNAEPNVVSLQLSDAAGSFENPTILKEITTDLGGTLTGILPEDIELGSYKVRVVTTNYPMISNEVSFNVISDIETAKAFNVKVYPNPVVDELHVSGLEEGAAYMIYDMTGRAIRSGNLVGGRTNVSELSNGFYFIQTEAGKVKFIKK